MIIYKLTWHLNFDKIKLYKLKYLILLNFRQIIIFHYQMLKLFFTIQQLLTKYQFFYHFLFTKISKSNFGVVLEYFQTLNTLFEYSKLIFLIEFKYFPKFHKTPIPITFKQQ